MHPQSIGSWKFREYVHCITANSRADSFNHCNYFNYILSQPFHVFFLLFSTSSLFYFHLYCDKQLDTLSLQDIKGEVNLGATPKSLPMDTSVYRQAILQTKSGLGSPGIIFIPIFMLLHQTSTFYGLDMNSVNFLSS